MTSEFDKFDAKVNLNDIASMYSCPPIQDDYRPYPWITPTTYQKGWECPRCGKINAPWVDHCNCARKGDITWTNDSLS